MLVEIREIRSTVDGLTLMAKGNHATGLTPGATYSAKEIADRIADITDGDYFRNKTPDESSKPSTKVETKGEWVEVPPAYKPSAPKTVDPTKSTGARQWIRDKWGSGSKSS